MSKKTAKWILEESQGKDRSQPKPGIVRGEVGELILLEIDAPKIRSVGKTQKASVRRKIRTALDAIKRGIDSVETQEMCKSP